MERQFLTFIALILFVFSGCQQNPINTEIKTNELASFDDSIDRVTSVPKNNEYKDIWEFMILNSDKTQYVIDSKTLSYMNNHLSDIDQFHDYLNDSYYFMYFVVQELKKKDLPLELALLPYIESNYDPFSISSSGAVGIWQFMPRTGNLYNLDRSWWNEDRHDPFKSTIAAVEYLDYLYKRFDKDIYHTLAAYNAGPSLLGRKIKKNQRKKLEIDFWSLDELPAQTKNYIPKFIALREVVFNSSNYGVNLPKIPNENVVVKIEIPGQIEVNTLSEYLEMKPELLYKLNAGYTKWASAPEDVSIFFIPIEKHYFFLESENPSAISNSINWISHEVQRGDSLWELAKKYDTEVSVIKQINYKNDNLLSIGSTLLIPLGKTESNKFIPYEMHIVSEGDTLWSIARKYNLEIRDITKMNSIDKNSYLKLGQQLSIGNKNIHRNIESKKRTILYSVKQGDNLFKISKLFDVSIESINKLNEFDNAVLMPGQVIKISIRAF